MTITAARSEPQQYTDTYEPVEASATRSRHDLKLTLYAWGLEDLVDSACLAITELVANAVRHCRLPGGLIEVTVLRSGESQVRIAVQDSCPSPVSKREVTPDEESGRGLFLVEAVSSSWGSTPLPQGKLVWAEISSQ